MTAERRFPDRDLLSELGGKPGDRESLCAYSRKMDVGAGLQGSVQEELWPLVESYLGSHDVAGLAVAVVRDEEVVSRGFGVRDAGTGTPVTPETMFHLASVSKPFVATAIATLATARGAGEPVLDLDAPITELVPEFEAGRRPGRGGHRPAPVEPRERTPRHRGLRLARSSARRRRAQRVRRQHLGLAAAVGAGLGVLLFQRRFRALGLLLSRVTGKTFEHAVRDLVLAPLGMQNSTFLRGDVPAHLAASPHVGLPLSVPEGSYPYTRRHAPSSSLHSNLVEMCRWMVAHFEPAEGSDGQWARLDPALVEQMWQPVMPVERPPWMDRWDAAGSWAATADIER